MGSGVRDLLMEPLFKEETEPALFGESKEQYFVMVQTSSLNKKH